MILAKRPRSDYPLQGMYSDKTLIQKDTRTLMFIAALFTVAKTWKKPKWPLGKQMDKDVIHIYNRTPLSHKKEWNIAIGSNMNGPRDYQNNEI